MESKCVQRPITAGFFLLKNLRPTFSVYSLSIYPVIQNSGGKRNGGVRESEKEIRGMWGLEVIIDAHVKFGKDKKKTQEKEENKRQRIKKQNCRTGENRGGE